jgi:hypothetical protein
MLIVEFADLKIGSPTERYSTSMAKYLHTFQSPFARSIAAEGLGQSTGSPAAMPPSIKSKDNATKKMSSAIGSYRLAGWQIVSLRRVYLVGLAGSAGAGPGKGTLIDDSGWLGVISAPALFAALKVVPGGVCGGRLSTIKLVWSTTSRVTIETAAKIAAITAGFRKTLAIVIQESDARFVPARGTFPRM